MLRALSMVMAMVLASACVGEPREPCPVDVVGGVVVDPDTCAPPTLSPLQCRHDDDCGNETLCYDVMCTRDVACRDDDDDTVCADDCTGVCRDPERVGYCLDDNDCLVEGPDGPEQYFCRRGEDICVRDRRVDGEPGCVGYCIAGCFLLSVTYIDPESGACISLDSCGPPGFAQSDLSAEECNTAEAQRETIK